MLLQHGDALCWARNDMTDKASCTRARCLAEGFANYFSAFQGQVVPAAQHSITVLGGTSAACSRPGPKNYSSLYRRRGVLGSVRRRVCARFACLWVTKSRDSRKYNFFISTCRREEFGPARRERRGQKKPIIPWNDQLLLDLLSPFWFVREPKWRPHG